MASPWSIGTGIMIKKDRMKRPTDFSLKLYSKTWDLLVLVKANQTSPNSMEFLWWSSYDQELRYDDNFQFHRQISSMSSYYGIKHHVMYISMQNFKSILYRKLDQILLVRFDTA